MGGFATLNNIHFSQTPAPEAANLDKETIERLASLGYIGTSTPARAAPGAGTTLADPKDKLEVFTAVQRAGELMIDDDHATLSDPRPEVDWPRCRRGLTNAALVCRGMVCASTSPDRVSRAANRDSVPCR